MLQNNSTETIEIRCPSELKSNFRLKVLEPFGLEIRANSGEPLSRIQPELLDRILQSEKLVVLRGFEFMERSSFLEYCENFPGKKPLEWQFGPVMEMKEDPNPQNYLFSREKVPVHWDGAFHTVPDYLVFHCIQAPPADAGGETLFCHTEKVWERATAAQKKSWSKLTLKYQTAKLAHYGGEIVEPLVQKHPRSGQTILRFAEPVTSSLNPVRIEVSGLEHTDADLFLADVKSHVYHNAVMYQHRWEVGDYLFADNYSLIHGRNEFTENCPRHLRRIQLV
jgi:alpha-ketoglutarate-dependent taurine dioxygenase